MKTSSKTTVYINSNIPINTGNAFYIDELQKFTLP